MSRLIHFDEVEPWPDEPERKPEAALPKHNGELIGFRGWLVDKDLQLLFVSARSTKAATSVTCHTWTKMEI
jgi:hypothetical protein